MNATGTSSIRQAILSYWRQAMVLGLSIPLLTWVALMPPFAQRSRVSQFRRPTRYTGFWSGHTLKHLVAAAATYALLCGLQGHVRREHSSEMGARQVSERIDVLNVSH